MPIPFLLLIIVIAGGMFPVRRTDAVLWRKENVMYSAGVSLYDVYEGVLSQEEMR